MMETLGGMELKQLILFGGATFGILIVTQLSAFGAGLGWIIRTAFNAGKKVGYDKAFKERVLKDLNAAHKKIREQEEKDRS